MLKKISILIACIFLSQLIYAQIPAGQCGILCTYDASGNRIKREYYCNNINPSKVSVQKFDSPNENAVFTAVDALYPNPTSGKFFISFAIPLSNDEIKIVNTNGQVIKSFKGNGQKIEVDLTGFANGIYNIIILSNEKVITKKVVKL